MHVVNLKLHSYKIFLDIEASIKDTLLTRQPPLPAQLFLRIVPTFLKLLHHILSQLLDHNTKEKHTKYRSTSTRRYFSKHDLNNAATITVEY